MTQDCTIRLSKPVTDTETNAMVLKIVSLYLMERVAEVDMTSELHILPFIYEIAYVHPL
jgi:hypothetical protein